MSGSPPPAAPSPEPDPNSKERPVTPLIGLGASAGGLGALKRFFSSLPQDADYCAYLVVQHLDPEHESMMAELVGNVSALPVVLGSEGAAVEAGHVYMIPPGKYMVVKDGTPRLTNPNASRGTRMAVDFLFRSIAEEAGENAAAIVLTGTGRDGAEGVRAIATAGGLCAAQDPSTAEYASMPEAAIGTGHVHIVQAVERLPRMVLDALRRSTEAETDRDHADMQEVLAIIQSRRGADFQPYKLNTIARRIARRMGMLHIETLDRYAERLREDEAEVEQLSRDMLIGVTGFFRDPEVFGYLRREVIPAMFEDARRGSEVRAWVAGCSTGEEAYTVAMLLLEQARIANDPIPVQVFASDVDPRALDHARRALYDDSAMEPVPEELRERFFKRDGERGYVADKPLRDAVIFADQNVLSDPPFSRLDLVTCRNLLIYLKPDVQEGLLSIFHFALKPEGRLVLGGSEGIGRDTEKFRVVSRLHRVFQRLGSGKGSLPKLPLQRAWEVRDTLPDAPEHTAPRTSSAGERLQKWLSDTYAPAAVLIDEQHRVVHFSGTAHRFLRIPEGGPTSDFFSMLDAGPGMRIRVLLARAIRTGEGETPRPIILGSRGQGGTGPFEARIGVTPLPFGEHNRLYAITFQDSDAPFEYANDADERSVVRQLERELHTTREDLQTTIEELKASNEEAMSVNEELQSANEELEASKEELQSLNEELTTVNSQLRDKLEEVESISNDINNLLVSTDLGVLFLDRDLRIKRFTPTLTDLFRLVPADIGRHVGDITRRFEAPELENDALRVIERLERSERRVEGEDGRIYTQRMLPYRTHENKIEGVVITYADTTRLVRNIEERERSRQQQAALAELSRHVIETDSLDSVFESVVRLGRAAMSADFAEILKLESRDGPLLLTHGVGWAPGIVGEASVAIDDDTQAGYTLRNETAVVVEDLDTETRFHGPALLTDHHVRSGISCVIPKGGHAWGILGIHSKAPSRFSTEDISFAESLAATLGQAMAYWDSQSEVQRQKERFEFALDVSEVGAWEYHPGTQETIWSDVQRRLMGMEREHVSREAFWERVHPDDRASLRERIEAAVSDRRAFRADYRLILPSGDVRWIHSAGALVEHAAGEDIMYGVDFDITDRKTIEARLERARAELESSANEHERIADERLAALRTMTHEMVIAESTERKQLAGELHDNLGQLLNLALMRLGAMRDEDSGMSRTKLFELEKIIRDASDATRSITGQLSPQVLDELGFRPAVDWLAEEIEKTYDLRVDVEHSGEPSNLAHAHELILYRAVRELLINVARHAQVDRAVVRLSKDDDKFRLVVSDAGVGFDAEMVFRRASHSHGLFGIRERIKHIGGEVAIESSEGDGCHVSITVPDGSPSEVDDERDG